MRNTNFGYEGVIFCLCVLERLIIQRAAKSARLMRGRGTDVSLWTSSKGGDEARGRGCRCSRTLVTGCRACPAGYSLVMTWMMARSPSVQMEGKGCALWVSL
jgi:hypothetical protein